MAEWARRNSVIYAGFTSLAAHEAVVRLIETEIATVNDTLARVEQVKKFRIIPKELDPEEGDTTPTRKVKRKHLAAMFEALIEEMYVDGAGAISLEAAPSSERSKQKVEA